MSRGIDRERQVRRHLESPEGGGWWCARAAGSLGDADIVALKVGKRPRLIEVKSSAKGPFEHFRPPDRAELLQAAGLAGADAELAYWPPRGELRFLRPDEWP